MRRILSFIFLLLSLIPLPVVAATLTFPSQLTEHYFFFLGSLEGRPIVWTILDDPKSAYPLAVSQYVFPNRVFDQEGNTDYTESDLRTYLDGEFYETVFSEPEKRLIANVGSSETKNSDWQSPTPLPEGQGFYLFPLSAAEARDQLLVHDMLPGISFEGSITADYWLRSPHQSLQGHCGEARGNDVIGTKRVTDASGVRPAFRMDLSSLVFVRKSLNEDYGTVGKIDTNDFNRSAEYKCCFLSEHLSLQVESVTYDPVSKLLKVAYLDAKTLPDTYLSAIVVNNSGTIRGYGRLKKISDGSGTVIADIPFDLNNEQLSIQIFLEQGETKTTFDLASRPIIPSVAVAQVTRPLPFWFWLILGGAALLIIAFAAIKVKFNKEF